MRHLIDGVPRWLLVAVPSVAVLAVGGGVLVSHVDLTGPASSASPAPVASTVASDTRPGGAAAEARAAQQRAIAAAQAKRDADRAAAEAAARAEAERAAAEAAAKAEADRIAAEIAKQVAGELAAADAATQAEAARVAADAEAAAEQRRADGSAAADANLDRMIDSFAETHTAQNAAVACGVAATDLTVAGATSSRVGPPQYPSPGDAWHVGGYWNPGTLIFWPDGGEPQCQY